LTGQKISICMVISSNKGSIGKTGRLIEGRSIPVISMMIKASSPSYPSYISGSVFLLRVMK
jgi:hypothetical protein